MDDQLCNEVLKAVEACVELAEGSADGGEAGGHAAGDGLDLDQLLGAEL